MIFNSSYPKREEGVHKINPFKKNQKMIIPIKCFTCGTVLADKYRYYLQEVRKRKLDENKDVRTLENLDSVAPKVVYLTKNFSKRTAEGDVLDELRLTKMCCRRHMLTHVDID